MNLWVTLRRAARAEFIEAAAGATPLHMNTN
jgi:hypothetical protein